MQLKHIAIHSVPRSGSTWLGEIINSSPIVKYCYQPLFSYAFKDALSENSTEIDISNFFNAISVSDDEFISQLSSRETGRLPKFRKSYPLTHTAYKEVRYHHLLPNLLASSTDLKTILLVRNPVEVMNSWICAPKEFDPSWNIRDELFEATRKNLSQKENFYGLRLWADTAHRFENLANKYPERVYLVNYLHLKTDPLGITKNLFDFCDIQLSDQTYDFIAISSKTIDDDKYSVFRGGAGSEITLEQSIICTIEKYATQRGLQHYLS